MPKSSVHGWQAIFSPLVLIKHLCHLIVTVHGLDTGIHAGMTASLNGSDAPAWERGMSAPAVVDAERQIMRSHGDRENDQKSQSIEIKRSLNHPQTHTPRQHLPIWRRWRGRTATN